MRTSSRCCREWKTPDEEETGYCGNCQHCNGVDEKKDVCKCNLRNPHRDWRFNNNEACPDWEPDELTRRSLGWDSQKRR